MRGLAAEGHEVTVVAPYEAEDKPANYNEIFIDKLAERFKNGDQFQPLNDATIIKFNEIPHFNPQVIWLL